MGRSFENRKASIFKTADKKSKVYSKYGTQLYVAARKGVPDPESNPSLRMLIERARRDQVPAHVIDKAIEKAKGAGGEDFAEARYEGFGPGGVSVIVDCLTDNNHRTVTDVRNCFMKTHSKLGPAGSVAHMFDHVAILSFKGPDEDAVLEALLNADVDVKDIEDNDGQLTLFAPANEYAKARTALLEAFPDLTLDADEVTFHAQTKKQLAPDDVPAFEKLLDLLEDCHDVQEVYHNAELP